MLSDTTHRFLRQNSVVLGGTMNPELTTEEVAETTAPAETVELLVEEVSIDGLCGVY